MNKKNLLKKEKSLTSKKKLSIILAASLLPAVAIATTVGTISNINFVSNYGLEKNNSDVQENDVINSKTPLDFFSQTPVLSQKTGPIISYGSKISSLDWYGATLWEFDLSGKDSKYMPKFANPSNYVPYTNRAFVNWSLDEKNNYLWLLTNTSKHKYQEFNNGIPPQNIIKLNSLTGEVISCTPINQWFDSRYAIYYQIQALRNGKVLVYSPGYNAWWRTVLYDPKTNTQVFKTDISEERKSEVYNIAREASGGRGADVRLQYLIPIIENVNIAVFCYFNASHTYAPELDDLFLSLVDDNLEKINVSSNSPWSKMIKIEKNIDDPYGWEAENYNKSYFTTLDGKVYWTAWGKFFVFFPELTKDGIPFKDFSFEYNKRIMSYTMDVNENVFFKYWNDSTIYSLLINGDTQENTTFQNSSYYIISDSLLEPVRKEADNFVIYNVNGYTGSIMLLASKIVKEGKFLTNQLPEDPLCGIAAAIVQNEQNTIYGDCKGLLNTQNSFLKSSDFTISPTILETKIPSEITPLDLTMLNGGFLTENKSWDYTNNTLKYPPFKFDVLNDETGYFKLTVNIDQIPWFTNSLPANAIPKTITKEFNTKITIKDKVSWKALNNYNFKNTLPSKITNNDILEFDPFQASFNSQTIVGANGNIAFPQKNYKIVSANNNIGEIVIECTYKYVPLGVVYTNNKDALEYTSKNTYKVFDNKTQPIFYFVGSNTPASSVSQTEIDVRQVPELKVLSESNLLPSSFENQQASLFLQFINTDKTIGYPLSWMTFSVIANDQLGKLTIIAKVKDGYFDNPNIQTSFVQVYTGLNKIQDYSFAFIKDANTIGNNPFKNILPSAINEGDVINNLVTYSGFISSDFQVTLVPNDIDGILNVIIKLSKSYSPILGNTNGFNDYTASYTFTNFMDMNQYNNQYNIVFESNNSLELSNIKKLSTYEIYNTLVLQNKELTIDNKTYKNLNDLTQQFFIKSIGRMLPQTNWATNKNIKTEMVYDGYAGTMNIKVQIDKSILNGFDSNVIYWGNFSGFAKSNVVPTSDNFNFITQDELLINVPEIISEKMDASKFAQWIKSSPNNFLKLTSYVTGQYVDLIKSGEYKLLITTNDNYNTLTLTINFENVKNPESLKSYSYQYQL